MPTWRSCWTSTSIIALQSEKAGSVTEIAKRQPPAPSRQPGLVEQLLGLRLVERREAGVAVDPLALALDAGVHRRLPQAVEGELRFMASRSIAVGDRLPHLEVVERRLASG